MSLGSGARRSLLAGVAVCVLVACSNSDDVPAPPVAGAGDIETSPPIEPSPSESESEPDDETGAQPIGDDEPLYAPLPELTPDPDNDIPDELEQMILDAFAEAYVAEHEAYAAAEVDEEALRKTHFGDGFASVIGAVDYLQGRESRELTPDAEVIDVSFTDFAGGVAILRECVRFGPRSGLYEIHGSGRLEGPPLDSIARDRMIELVRWDGEEQPSMRVTQIGFADPENCGAGS